MPTSSSSTQNSVRGASLSASLIAATCRAWRRPSDNLPIGTKRSSRHANRATLPSKAWLARHVEQMNRQRDRLKVLPVGDAFPLPVTLLNLGGAVWVLTPGELYHEFQVLLRTRFSNTALIIATLVGDWNPGYVPAASSYGRGIYEATIASIGAGSLETLTAAVTSEIDQLLNRST